MTNADIADKELDALYDLVMNCEPDATESEADKVADLIFSKERVIRAWRLAAVLSSKGGDWYREFAGDANLARGLAPTVGILDDFAELLRNMAALAESAAMRMKIAGCNHEHFFEWMEAETE